MKTDDILSGIKALFVLHHYPSAAKKPGPFCARVHQHDNHSAAEPPCELVIPKEK